MQCTCYEVFFWAFSLFSLLFPQRLSIISSYPDYDRNTDWTSGRLGSGIDLSTPQRSHIPLALTQNLYRKARDTPHALGAHRRCGSGGGRGTRSPLPPFGLSLPRVVLQRIIPHTMSLTSAADTKGKESQSCEASRNIPGGKVTSLKIFRVMSLRR